MKKAESVATEVAKVKLQPEEEKLIEKKKVTSKREKIWLNKGLYAGQEARNFDWFQDSLGKDKENMDEIAPYKPNSFMPLPMWHGQRLLHVGRHFKLPFDVCSPLPPGQPKPDEWRKTSSSKWSLCLS
jgi:histone-lysine N-methyltransferase ASH1L